MNHPGPNLLTFTHPDGTTKQYGASTVWLNTDGTRLAYLTYDWRHAHPVLPPTAPGVYPLNNDPNYPPGTTLTITPTPGTPWWDDRDQPDSDLRNLLA